MDSRYATPLFDLFRRGEVSHDVRMLAARGILAPRPHEQLALLALLSVDADPAVRQAAVQTLGRIPLEALRAFLARADVSPDLRAFFAVRGVEPATHPAGEDEQPLISEVEIEGDQGETEPDGSASGGEPAGDDAEADLRRMATVQRLSLLTVTQKVKVAMRGNREERAILIRDPNKLVAIGVLSSPKLSAQEVEGFAKLASVSEDVLRVIGTTRAWVKNYGVINSLCRNPKTPIALSLGFVKYLIERDVRALYADRNLPDPLKIAARKIIQAGQGRRG